MDIRIITTPITRAQALEIGKEFYNDMVKGVVDLEQEIIVLGGEYHMDANVVLLDNGSFQSNLWGFNLHSTRSGDEWIEYTSLINIRLKANNRTTLVQDESIRRSMKKIIEKLVI